MVLGFKLVGFLSKGLEEKTDGTLKLAKFSKKSLEAFVIRHGVTSSTVFQFKGSFMLSGNYAQICPSSALFSSVFLQVF